MSDRRAKDRPRRSTGLSDLRRLLGLAGKEDQIHARTVSHRATHSPLHQRYQQTELLPLLPLAHVAEARLRRQAPQAQHGDKARQLQLARSCCSAGDPLLLPSTPMSVPLCRLEGLRRPTPLGRLV